MATKTKVTKAKTAKKGYHHKVTYNGNTYYYNENNQYHRTDGPAVERASGSKVWYVDGKRHRTDGPAIKWADGSKSWYVNGKRHRTDGPAIEWADGYKEWYVNGEYLTENQFLDKYGKQNNGNPKPGYHHKATYGGDTFYYNEYNNYHRTDGPAIECADGTKRYYINGTPLTLDEYFFRGGMLPPTSPNNESSKTEKHPIQLMVEYTTVKIPTSVTIDGVKYRLTKDQ